MHCIFNLNIVFRTDLPYLSVNVLKPSQRQSASTVVVEQGRSVDIECTARSVFGFEPITWLQIVDGEEVRGEMNTGILETVCYLNSHFSS